MDSAQWKSQSVAINVYLTAWYYPLMMLTTRDFEDDPPSVAQPPIRSGKNASASDSRSPALQPFPVPDGNADKNTGLAPSSAQPTISKHRVLMANIESMRNKNDGAVTLTSKRFNIKLDKQTTYVLAVGDLGAGPG
jgi:hypothetical protein